MKDDLLRVDAQLRAEGAALLEDRGLRALIAEYAPVHAMGSYALELMAWRDLDLTVDAPDITISQFFELGARITDMLAPWRMNFHNHRDYEQGEYPRGLYWGIRLGDILRGAWKIDLWAYNSEDCAASIRRRDELKGRLNARDRLRILDIKSNIWTHPQYRHTITSQDIYDSVLDHGVRTTEEFWRYIEDKACS